MNELRRFTSDQKLKDSTVAANGPAAAVGPAAKPESGRSPGGRHPRTGPAGIRGQSCQGSGSHGLDSAASVPPRSGAEGVRQLPEARQVFDLVVKNHGNRPEAIEAALRYGQTLKDEGLLRIDACRSCWRNRDASRSRLRRTAKSSAEGFTMIGEAVKYLEGRAEALKASKPDAPARARMLYDATWATRALAMPTSRRRARRSSRTNGRR